MARCLPRPSCPAPVTRWGPLLLLLGLLGAPARADVFDAPNDEPPTVAIIPFGAQTAPQVLHVNGACEEALRRIPGLRVLPATAWEKEARESGQGDDLEAMARRLGADALITGSLVRGPQGFRLSVDVFDGKAQPLQSFELDLVVPEVGPAASFRLEEALARIIRPLVGLRDKVDQPEEHGPEPAPQSTDRERIVPLADIEGIRPKAPPARRMYWPPWRPFIEARAGLLVSGRTTSCGEATPARLNLPCTDTLFPLDAGAGLRLDVGLYPLARILSLPKPLLGLGVGLLVELPGWRDRALERDSSAVPVRQLRIEGGLRWRWNIGDRVRRPILDLGLAYGYHSFALQNDSVPYPDMQYQYLLPSLGLGSYLTARFSLRGAFALLAVFTAGEANEPLDDRNQNPFGPGRALGIRVTAEAEYLVWRKLSLSLGGALERVGHSLDGAGCTKAAAGQQLCDQRIARSEPPPPGITTVTDLYLSFWFQLGYRY